MSFGSTTLFGLALAFVLLATTVNAHGWMSSPTPRGQFLQTPKPSYMEYMPATRNASDPNIICRGDPVAPRANWIPLTAGTQQSISLEFTAKHVGDCFVYLSYDGEKAPLEMKWFKIWEQHACRDKTMYNIQIPSYLPSGDHVVFRWEWYALHVYPVVEYYTQCADATMTAAAPGGQLPSPLVRIPGHLPDLEGDYQQNTNNYWWPWDTQAMFFTGPPVATLNGATSKPTTAPAVQATEKPATQAPTQAAATQAPATQAPRPPTQAPVVPTQAPVVPTQAPAPVGPSSSVKLNVTPGSGYWWFVVTLSGARSNEITSLSLQDSALFNSGFSPLAKSWIDATAGQVWVFDPSTKGALTLPITIKASVASGASLSFTVNKISSTTVDSGAVFAY